MTSFLQASELKRQHSRNAIQKKEAQLEIDKIALGKYEAAHGMVSTEEFSAIMKEASLEAQQYAISTQGAAGSTQVFTASQNESIKVLRNAEQASMATSLGIKALNVALNAGAMIAFSMAVQFISKIIDNCIVTLDEQKEKVKDCASAYQSAQAELSSINSELKAQNKLIDELNSRNNLTYAEQGQLDELQKITKELEIQKDIAEETEKTTQKELAVEAVKLVKKQFGESPVSEKTITLDAQMSSGSLFSSFSDYSSYTGDLSQLLAHYSLVVQKLDVLYESSDLEDNLEDNLEEIGFLTGISKDISDQIWENASILQEQKINMQDYYDLIKDTPYDLLSAADKEIVDTYNRISNDIKMIYSVLKPNEWNDMEITSILNSRGIEKSKEELMDMARANILTPEIIEGFSTLRDAINNSELLYDDYSSAIEAFCNEIYAYVDAENNLGRYTPHRLSFADLLNNNAFSSSIDEYIDKINQLNNALEQVENGSLDSSDLYELTKSFSELSGQTDHLETAIPDLIAELTGGEDEFGNFTGIYKIFQDQFGNLRTEKDKAQLRSLMDTVLSLGKLEEPFHGDLSFVDIISDIKTLSEGFEQLSSIYTDVYNQEDFNWSSILNNESFENAFGHLEDVTKEYQNAYEDFIQTVSNSTDDLGACQSAFDSLATAYIYHSGVLENVNRYTKDTAVTMLEQMGISNALEIVEYQLAQNEALLAGAKSQLNNVIIQSASSVRTESQAKYLAKLQTMDLENATYDEMITLLNEANQLDVNAQMLAEFALKKAHSNNIVIDEYTSTNQLLTLAKAAGIASGAMSKITYLEQLYNQKRTAGASSNELLAISNELQKEKQNITNEINSFQAISSEIVPRAAYTVKQIDQSTVNSTKNINTGSESSAPAPTTETFNFIETLIKRLSSAFDRLKKKGENTFASFSSRASAYRSALTNITDQIAAQEQAYTAYLTRANSVGLPETWAKQVRSGSIHIADITDDALKERIKNYQDWYEKACACKDAITDLRQEEAELYRTSFDHISAQYDGLLQTIAHKKSMLEESISQTEQKGFITSTRYYTALMKQEQSNISQLEKEKSALIQSLQDAVNSGAVTKGSEAWQNMSGSIDDVTFSIEQANTSLLEYSNHIRKIKWQVFDLIQERISRITSEADFLINLMENDTLYSETGLLTDTGLSVMGLHGVNYNVYMKQADQYADELLRIDKELSASPYHTDLLERRQELLELQQEMILAAKEEKEAVSDLVSNGIEKELDSLKDLIDTYEAAFDSQKDLYDYQKNIKAQTKEISSLQKQLSAYEGDLSEESKVKIQQLKVSLEEATESLKETEYERYISDQKQLLDELYTEYETTLHMRLDHIDGLISEVISAVNDNSSMIHAVLSEKADSVGYTLSDSMKAIWEADNAKTTAVLSTYNTSLTNGFTSVSRTLDAIRSSISNMISYLDQTANQETAAVNSGSALTGGTTASGSSDSKSAISGFSGSKSSSGQSSSGVSWGSWFVKKSNGYAKNKLNVNVSIVDRLNYFNFDSSMSARKTYFSQMGGTGNYTGTSSQNEWMIQQMKNHGYRNGVYHLSKNELAWTQEGHQTEAIIRPSDGAILTPLAQHDSVLRADATRNIFEMANDPIAFIRDHFSLGSIPLPAAQREENKIYNSDVSFSVSLPNVMNYEQFKYAMQHDRSFEQFVRSVTVDQMFGGSSLKKYNL